MLDHQKYEFLRSELKRARQEANLLQSDLAKKLNKPQSYISKIESGERTLDVVECINLCVAMGLNPATWLKRFIEKI
jgi:transcriptional regulator with XRE-family HTH domain